MDRTLIIVGSVTYAMKARDILEKNGISAYVERTRKTKEFGCGYGVHVPKRAEEAEQLLLRNSIKVIARITREEK